MKNRQIRFFLGLFYLFFLAAGCATPQVVKVSEDYSVQKSKEYKKLYLIKPDKDPRNIFPIVRTKLREIGFDVEEVNLEDGIGGSQGTGFVIHPDGYVLTCAHVVKKDSRATVWLSGTRFETEVVHQDADKDLAVLKLAGCTSPLEALAFDFTGDYHMGDEVYTIGFPLSNILGNAPRLNKGLLSSTVGMKDDPEFVQVSAEIQPGNSGGPLLNESGAVVGVMQATLNPLSVMQKTGGSLPQNVNFAVKAPVVKAFIESGPEAIAVRTNVPEDHSFDRVKDSVVQVYSGIVTEAFLKQPKIVCAVAYRSFWDVWYRFAVFNIDFYDYESGELLLRAGQYGDNLLSTEKKVIEQTFEQIKGKFFPGA